jgi:hypothetical protein
MNTKRLKGLKEAKGIALSGYPVKAIMALRDSNPGLSLSASTIRRHLESWGYHVTGSACEQVGQPLTPERLDRMLDKLYTGYLEGALWVDIYDLVQEVIKLQKANQAYSLLARDLYGHAVALKRMYGNKAPMSAGTVALAHRARKLFTAKP